MTDKVNKFIKGGRSLNFQAARVDLVKQFAARDIFIAPQVAPNSDEM